VFVQVHFLEIYQSNIMEFWAEFGDDMMGKLPSMTLDTFKYARALVRGGCAAASGLRGWTSQCAHVACCGFWGGGAREGAKGRGGEGRGEGRREGGRGGGRGGGASPAWLAACMLVAQDH